MFQVVVRMTSLVIRHVSISTTLCMSVIAMMDFFFIAMDTHVWVSFYNLFLNDLDFLKTMQVLELTRHS